MEKNKNQKYKIAMIIVVTIFITFLLTMASFFYIFIKGEKVGKYILVTPSEENEQISEELQKFRTLIDKYYLGEVDEEKLKEGAIKGYIEGLGDPYTEYIPKQETEEYLETTKGNFVGIGIYMVKDEQKNLIKVLSTISGSPAERQGIKEGDLIKSVDGVEYTADDLDIISTKIKGEPGSVVNIELLRGEETINCKIEREKVIVNKVEGKVIEENIGYIKIPSFDETTSEEFKTEYLSLKSKGIESLIVDLRNNGGGIVSEALNIADFVADKDSVLLYEVDKEGKELVKKSEKEPIINIPVVLLVNKNTASSSEILAGALKDLGKAKIVGTTTFGKGVIQQILTLPDGSGLKITTEEYQTPNRNKIHKVGIEPDEIVDFSGTVPKNANVDLQNDTQLKKAIEIVKN